MKNCFVDAKGKFGFGCMRLPMQGDVVDWDQTSRMVDLFLEAGFNYFDTARVYLDRQSEQAIKRCLADRYPRDRFLLADKLSDSCFRNQEDIRPLVQRQLDSCGVTYLDYYLMHAQDAKRFERYRSCRAYETAFELRDEGVLRHVGLSFHDGADVLDEILKTYPELEFVQIQLNYLDYDDGVIQSRKCYEVCEKYGKPVVVMEPVKGGRLARLSEKEHAVLSRLGGGMSDAGYALRFAADHPSVAMVLSGMSSVEQMEDNIRVMKECKPLSDEEKKALSEVRAIALGEGQIGCTACRYCTDGCPAGISIPDLITALNSNRTGNGWTSHKFYRTLTASGGKASDCLDCGQCEEACPQHLPIREILQQIRETFEKADEE